ncbi:Protein ELYS, partial [Orchesella cincta]
ENFENSINLENLLSPFLYEPETPHRKTIPEVPGGFYLSGFISQDCTWGCTYNHSVIKCFPVDRYFEEHRTCNPSIAVSSASYAFHGARITCVTELAIHNQRTSSGTRKLLLGISYTQDNNNKDLMGAVVIFDPLRCSPMKWIEIPEPVSSITVLSHFEEGGSNRPFFNETMMAMVGIAAVGLRGGSVIIVDLGLDDPILTASCTPDSKNISELTYKLLYVGPHEYVIATKRHKAVSKRGLIALRFTNEPQEGEVFSDAFHYCKPNGDIIVTLHKNSVAVSCIEYVPFIGSLLVGFTCGTFQIWRVNNMELQFSSEPVGNIERGVPVFGFSFQQPVDDPKNYCYVWVVFGNNSNECGNASVELHSLIYERKSYIENFGYTYDGFRHCARRMSVPLQDDFLSTDSEVEDSSIRCNARPLRIWTQPDTELMFCAWEVGRGGIYYVGAFDLNQWYSNHTKEYIIYNPITGLCPYWIALPVDIPEVSSLVLDVRIIPKSLMRWENPHSKLDVHLYPASVSFRAVCLTNNGVSAFEHFGVQEKLIRFMLKDGPSLMIQPASLKTSFMKYGLEPVFPHVYGEHLSEKDRDRYFIFTVLLESRRSSGILNLANAWLDGSYANVGCTVDLIIDWIASYMSAIRSMADSQWENLFSFSNDALAPGTVHFINFSNFAWTSLHMMLITLMNPSEVYTARRLELEDIEFGLGKLVQYSAALLMMYKTKLLPENDGNFIHGLTEYYQRRRAECRTALEASPFIDNQYKKSHPLMVDHFMDALLAKETLREEWHTPEGHALYPPQHVGYLVNMFMWLEADPKTVSRVFIDAERRVRGDFKAVMCTAADEYSEVFSLWLLDHGFHDEVFVRLKERNRLFETDGLPWCASAVALTAAGYENEVSELLLRSCPVTLARLLFSLMTSSGNKYCLLAELMVNSSLNADEELLQQFFQISKARDRLGEFIRTKSKELTVGVRRAFLNFLKESDSLEHITLLLMFYIHTEDYQKLEEEFLQVQNTLLHRNLCEADRRKWKFQENYIQHLLSVKKGSVVNNFLRLQSPQTSRQVASTVSIKARPAPDSEAPTPERSLKGMRASKLPPQLRRLKLSETLSHDPLSPLRRYVGRIQTAVTANTSVFDQEELGYEMEAMRAAQRRSRTSFSRRSSMISHKPRFSLANSTVFENTVLNDTISEEGLNQTMRTNIDLISLLKTPAIDHRLENRPKSSAGASINCTHNASVGAFEESVLQPPHVHSIMKEKDSSKPKRKVELRFDNVSTSEDEEKNETIYEDANDVVGETSVVIDPASDTGDHSLTDEPMNTSMEETEDIPPVCINDVSIELPQSLARDSDLVSVHPAALTPIPETSSAEESFVSGCEADDDVIHGTSKSFITNVEETRDDINISADEESLNVEIPENSEDIFTKPTKPVSSPSKERIEKESTEKQENEDSDSVKEKVEEIVVNVSERYPEQLRTRSSKSKSPAREVTEEPVIPPPDVVNPRSSRSSRTPTSEETQEDEPKKNTQRSARTSRSRTPTIENTEAQDVENTSVRSRVTRASRSRTPTREHLETHDVEEISVVHNTRSRTPSRDHVEHQDVEVSSSRRITRSRTPTREHVELQDMEQTSSRPITRSRTPTREHVEAQNVDESSARRITRSRTPNRDTAETTDEPQVKRSRQSIRLSRSTTPTRDLTEDIFEQSQNQSLPVRRKRRISRSTTPTREMSVTRDNEETEMNVDNDDTQTKPVRRSARTSKSKTRELLFEGGDDEQSESKPVHRGTRSRTPSRDVVEDVPEVTVSKATRRTLRASRSMTPTRDLQPEGVVEEEPEAKTSRRSTRTSRSRDSIGRELDGIPEENQEELLETTVVRKSLRTSKTPTRELFEESGNADESETKTARKKGKSKSKSSPVAETTLTEDNEEDAQDTEPPEKSRKKKKQAEKPRAPKRRLKYFDHHQDLSTLIEVSGTEVSVSDPSILDATVLPAVTQKPPRRIKGIRARTVEPEPEVEPEPVQTKPTKRRKASNDDVPYEDDSDQVSTRSSRSASSRRSASSSKGKGSRRKASSTKSKA